MAEPRTLSTRERRRHLSPSRQKRRSRNNGGLGSRSRGSAKRGLEAGKSLSQIQSSHESMPPNLKWRGKQGMAARNTAIVRASTLVLQLVFRVLSPHDKCPVILGGAWPVFRPNGVEGSAVRDVDLRNERWIHHTGSLLPSTGCAISGARSPRWSIEHAATSRSRIRDPSGKQRQHFGCGFLNGSSMGSQSESRFVFNSASPAWGLSDDLARATVIFTFPFKQ